MAALEPRLSPPGQYHLDKIAHLGAFGLLAFLAVVGYANDRSRWTALLGIAALAVGIEIAQGFVPGRIGSFKDAAASLAGLPVGFMAGWLAERLLGSILPRT
jgi:VanZ family protein